LFCFNPFFILCIPKKAWMSDFDHIFRKYHNSLYLYANKFVRNESISLDIVQDVFASIWEKGKLELHDEHLKAYLFNAVKNSCFNYLKHERVVQDHQQRHIERIMQLEQKYYKSGEQSLIEKENLDKIYKAINALSVINREVIELSRFEGLRNKEIAKKLKLPVRTVETRLFRALSELKEKLSKNNLRILLNICALIKS